MDLVVDRIATGLKRRSITSCSAWAKMYRVMGPPFAGPWMFKYHPWTKDIHDCKEEEIVVQKAAQMGLTEVALNKTFYAIDVHGTSVLYVLPAATPDANDFSTARFDPALELSPHLSLLFSDVANIGHKRAGSASLYIRGSRSRSQLKSVPVGLAIGDEIDEMDQDNVPLIWERMSGQVEKQSYLLSTPTIDNYGINAKFKVSTQNHFYFRCPRCSRLTELTYPECLIIIGDSLFDPRLRESHLVCKECKGILDHATKYEWLRDGRWIESYSDRTIVGYYVNQLYSSTVHPGEIAAAKFRADSNPADEQELYNSKLGLTHAVEGAKVTDIMISNCIKGFKKLEIYTGMKIVTLGVDVGKWLHYEIDEWDWDFQLPSMEINMMAKARLIAEGKLQNFEDIDVLMRQYGVFFAVVDANPERRKATELAQRFWGRIKLCFYAVGVSGKSIHVHQDDEHTLSVDRTSWMDLSLSRFRTQRIDLPMDISTEYKDHIKAPVRVYKKDRTGNPVGSYVTGNEEDHFAHSRTYSEIALRLAACVARNENMSGVI